MIVIFSFSQQSGEQSEELSGGITEKVVDLLIEDFDEMPPQQQLSIMNRVTFVVRKLAHFTEYLILGLLLFQLVRTYTMKHSKEALISWCVGTLYAATDEFHQMFSDGRSPQVRDVCIDSAGVLTGVLVTLLILYFYESTIDKKRKKGLS
jgi:VanZ family protein